MNFELVLGKLTEEFDRLRLRYAVIGGFALGVLGAPRMTMDIDFLVHRDDSNQLHASLTALGYERIFHTANVSQYQHADAAWGSVDFVHAFRSVSLAMLERAKKYPIFGGKRSLPTLDPEDIIGLKVQAMVNDPSRTAKERNDIETLAERYAAKLDWDRVEEFYRAFALRDEAQKLRERFDRAD